MPDGLYEIDALAWAEEQADLLRRLAAGERVNGAIDWPHVIEEVFDVGQAQLIGRRSYLRQAILHRLKLHAWPDSQSEGQCRAEVGQFLDEAVDRFTPSMRQWLDLDDLYGKSVRRLGTLTDDSGRPHAVPTTCPFSLSELLAGDVGALLTKLSG